MYHVEAPISQREIDQHGKELTMKRARLMAWHRAIEENPTARSIELYETEKLPGVIPSTYRLRFHFTIVHEERANAGMSLLR